MDFFNKLIKLYKDSSRDKLIKQQPVQLALDDSFVHHFINKGGKFLYCTSFNEVISNFKKIVQENNWYKISCTDVDLQKIALKASIHTEKKTAFNLPFFTNCEHLIASNGDILFSSNQLRSQKLAALSEHFIVYATTSQLVKNTGEGLTGIKTNFRGNIPTNICAVKNYSLESSDEDSFMNYGNSNSKNLYLLLFEDL